MKILLVLQGLHGACPFYRSIGPFKRIEKDNPDIEVQVVDISQDSKPFWMHLTATDVVYFERPVSDSMLGIFRDISELGVKIWIDYDDNLMCLPKWNADHVNNGLHKKIIEKCASYADLITTSTFPLQKMFLKYNDNVQIIPNAFDNCLFKHGFKFSKKKIIFWRGSPTHDSDLEIFHSVYEQIYKFYSDWSWVVIGGGDCSIFKNRENITFLSYTPSLLSYFRQTLNISPGILLYPLVDNHFNFCKSHIAWLEATYFGAVTIAPNFPEWKKEKGCLVNYKKPEDIPLHIDELINNENDRQQMYIKSRRILQKNYMIDEINKIRIQLMRELCA